MMRLAPDAVAAGDLRRQAGERHQRVHEVRMALAPHPGVHAAHRRAHDQAQVIHAEAFGEQAVLRLDHVGVAVVRELRAQPVAGLGGFAVADAVGQHDEVLRRVERLARAEQLARELRPQELRAAAAGAVADEHRIAHDALARPSAACRACGSGCAARAASRRSRSGSRAGRSRLRPARGSRPRAPFPGLAMCRQSAIVETLAWARYSVFDA